MRSPIKRSVLILSTAASVRACAHTLGKWERRVEGEDGRASRIRRSLAAMRDRDGQSRRLLSIVRDDSGFSAASCEMRAHATVLLAICCRNVSLPRNRIVSRHCPRHMFPSPSSESTKKSNGPLGKTFCDSCSFPRRTLSLPLKHHGIAIWEKLSMSVSKFKIIVKMIEARYTSKQMTQSRD